MTLGACLPRPRARELRLRRHPRQCHPAAAGALSVGDDRQALVPAGLRPRQAGLAQPAAWTGWPTSARWAARSSPVTRRMPRPTCDSRSAARRTATSHGSATRLPKAAIAQHFSPASVSIEADRPRRLHRHRGRRRPRTDGLLLRHHRLRLRGPGAARGGCAPSTWSPSGCAAPHGLDSLPAGGPRLGHDSRQARDGDVVG